MNIGTTFSHKHASYLGLNPQEGLKKLISINLTPIRLCCYWNEIQPMKNKWNYSKIESLIEICEENRQNIVLTIGMKAPRWPEFHIPDWASVQSNEIETNCSNFVINTVRRFQKYKSITAWQIENEPLDPSGPKNEIVDQAFLESQIKSVKEIDNRPIMLTVWANTFNSRSCFNSILHMCDIIGLDIYFKVPGPGIYFGPEGGVLNIKEKLKHCSRPVWITELQAEPWENRWTKIRNGSMSHAKLLENFKQIVNLGAENILLWGSEFWLKESEQGRHGYLNTVNKIIYQTKA